MKLPKLFGNNAKKGMIPTPVLIGIGTVFGLFLIGIFVFAFALAGAEMENATSDATAKQVIQDTTAGASSFANFSPVLWIIAAIGILIGILLTSVGGYFLYNNMKN